MICWLAVNQGGLNVGKVTVTYTGELISDSGALVFHDVTLVDGPNVSLISAFAQMFFLVHSLKLLKKILVADGYVSPSKCGFAGSDIAKKKC